MKKKDSATKQAKGTLRSKREIETATSDLVSDLTAPEELPEDAKKEWDDVVGQLSGDRLFTALDKKMLMAYCFEMARYWRYQRELVTEDEIFELKNKLGEAVNWMKNPKIDLADRALKNAYNMGVNFGLTPLSRTKISMNPKSREKSPESKAQDILEGLKSGKPLMKAG